MVIVLLSSPSSMVTVGALGLANSYVAQSVHGPSSVFSLPPWRLWTPRTRTFTALTVPYLPVGANDARDMALPPILNSP